MTSKLSGPGRRGRRFYLFLLIAAAASGLLTWFASVRFIPAGLPPDFPFPSHSQISNEGLRKILGTVEREASENPGSAEAVGRLGMAYHANQLYDAASRAYRVAARLAPGDWRWIYYEALVREETGESLQMAVLLEKVLELEPACTPAATRLGDHYFKQGKLEDADRCYGRALASGIGSAPQAAFGRARVAAKRGDWQAVLARSEGLLREHPLFRPAYALLAEASEAVGDLGRAAAARQSLMRSDLTVVLPIDDPVADELIDLCFSSTQLLKQAGFASRHKAHELVVRLARRAVQVEPEDADARHFLAQALVRSRPGDPEAVKEALVQVAEGMRLNPDDLRPLLVMADLFFTQKRTEEAEEQLQAMLSMNSASAEAHYYLGVLADHRAEPEAALAHYRSALRLKPGYAEPLNKIGVSLARAGEISEAVKSFRKAIELKPSLALAHFNLAVALEQQGRSEEAIHEYRQALFFQPNDGAARLNLGLVLAQSGRLEEAAGNLREAVRLMPRDPEARFDLGCALASLGKHSEAAAEFRETLRLDPHYPEARRRLDDIESR